MNLPLSPDPFVLLTGVGWCGGESLLAKGFHSIVQTSDAREIPDALDLLEHHTREGQWAFGFIAYEAAAAFGLPVLPSMDLQVPLLWFGICSPENVQFIESPIELHSGLPIQDTKCSLQITTEDYQRSIETIRNHIAVGNTYQVNFTVRGKVYSEIDPLAWFGQLYLGQPVPYAAFIQTDFGHALSLSPELFIRRDGSRIVSQPMKGTLKRGRTLQEDAAQGNQLRSSEKDCAENVMIVDMVRHDLGKVCEFGSVRVSNLYEIETYSTLFQMTSTVEGHLRERTSLSAILHAAFPAASITGAPKHRTMEILAKMENSPRGLYCGSIGYIQPGGNFVFNVAIRTLFGVAPNYIGGVGGGIVWDSQVESEFQEIQTKLRFLTQPMRTFSLIETLLLQENGEYWLLEDHLKRLKSSADYWDFLFDREKIQTELFSYAEGLEEKPKTVRLLLNKYGDLILQHRDVLIPHMPIRVLFSASKVDSQDVFLFHKTTHREFYNQERDRARQLGFFEILFHNENGCITEGSVTNILYRCNDQWYTPPLLDGLLPGVWRERVIMEKSAVERSCTHNDLLNADEVWIGNSVIGGVRVDEWEGIDNS